jgi:predicted Zn-dependent protease
VQLGAVRSTVTGHPQARHGAAPVGSSPTGRTGDGSAKIITGTEGSVVFINDIRHGSTPASGELDLPRVKSGSYPIRIRTVGYADFHGTIVITPGGERTLKVKQLPTQDEGLIHYQKGENLRDAKNETEAVAEFKKAVRLKPGLAEARISMARSLISLEDFDGAETQLQAAIRLGGALAAEGTTVLANLRRSQGLYDEAIAAYRRAIRLARGVSPEAHIGLAIALEEKGSVGAAIAEYGAGIRQDMDTEPILYYLLGRAFEKQGDQDQAVEAYQGYLRLDPQGQYSSAVASIVDRLKKEPPR